jgi:hypothetical protein
MSGREVVEELLRRRSARHLTLHGIHDYRRVMVQRRLRAPSSLIVTLLRSLRGIPEVVRCGRSAR